MTAFNRIRISAITLYICAWFIAFKFGDAGMAVGVSIGYLVVWIPLAIWYGYHGEDAREPKR